MIKRLSLGWKCRRRSKSLLTRILFVVVVLSCSSILHSFTPGLQYFNSGQSRYFTRHLLSTSEWETCDFETDYLRNESDPDNKGITPNTAYAWMSLHIAGVIITFIALAIICDDFFVPSLEAISEKLDLSEDVAGATFMAAGSSAPELFTSVAGVTADSDVGVGTIVGSAVFNLLVIIALTAALTKQTLQLDWRPLLRDSVCYALSIAVFIVFAWDSKFEFYESVILLTLYFLYILVMKFNGSLMDYLERCGQKVGRVSPEVHDIPAVETVVEVADNQEENPTPAESTETGRPQGRLPPLQPLKVAFEGEAKSDHSFTVGHGHLPHFSHSHKGELSKSFTRRKSSVGAVLPHEMVKVKSIAAGHIQREMRRHSVQDKLPNSEATGENEVDETPQEHEDGYDGPHMKIFPCLPAVAISVPEFGDGRGLCSCLRYSVDWFLFFASFPFVCIFTWTIPNCSKAHNRKYFLVSFLASIIWIALLSFGMVTLVGRVGCILNIDKFTMGLVVVAIGTSIPDALSSIIVARDGFGDMAVSNAIGSNVFDIDLGIGLPFVLKSLIDDMDPIKLLTDEDQGIFWNQAFLSNTNDENQAKEFHPVKEKQCFELILYDNDEMVMVPHAKFGFILLLILFVCIGVFVGVKFRLGRTIGTSFFLMYIIFVAYAYIQDLHCEHDC